MFAANAVLGFSQSSLTAKDLSTSPIIDGTVIPTTLGFDASVSATEPTVALENGAIKVSCLANQTLVFNATNLTTQPFQPTGDYTIEYRVKVPVWNGGRGFDVYLRDGLNSQNFFCVTNERMYFNNTAIVSYYLDATRYHTYRYAVLRATGETYCWIDGVYRGKVTTLQAATGANLIQFGKSSTVNIIDFYLDYFTYDLTGAYKPTTTVLEEPAFTAKDVATTPSLDGTQLPEAAGWTLPTVSGTEYTVASTNGILDIDCPVNNQYVFQSPVTATNNLYSYEFRTKVSAATGRGVDIVIGNQLLCLTNTKLYNNSDGGSTVPLYEITDNNFHVYRFSGSGTGKYANVWVDSQYVGVTNVASASKFQLGKGNSSSATTFAVDYVTIDNTGSYKPYVVSTAITNQLLDSRKYSLVQNQDYIYINGLENKNSLIRIISINGQLLNTIGDYSDGESINVSSLKNGIYFVQIGEADKKTTLKFIKK
jgi:hypothetical protein